jgi:hypothetical protein
MSIVATAANAYLASVPWAEPAIDLVERRLMVSRGWIIVLGFVAFVVVMAYGAYCTSSGGSFSFTFGWLTGFTVKCRTPGSGSF